MNKRIKKKRMKLGDMHIGDHIYTRKEIMMINKAHLGYMNMRLLYPQIEKPKITRPRTKSLINYIYKNRIKYAKTRSFKHLRFARHLNELNHTDTTPVACNSCEPPIMEVD